MKTLVLHTLPPAEAGADRWREEFALDEGAAHVASVLADPVVAGVRGDPAEILGLIDAHRPDAVFNLCEAPLGRPELEPHPAALFEWLGLPFTGSGSETLALCRQKPRIQAVLAAHGIAVPRGGVFPAIVKPADQDGSAGIHVDAMCADADAVQRARGRWPGAVVVQEFLPGREFAVSLWGRRGPEHGAVGETVFGGDLKLNTYASKWDTESAEYADSPLEYGTAIAPALRTQLLAAARGAWHAAAARGYLRVDLRCDADGVPRVLDVNPNPALAAGIGICRSLAEAGWDWADFVRLQLEAARDR